MHSMKKLIKEGNERKESRDGGLLGLTASVLGNFIRPQIDFLRTSDLQRIIGSGFRVEFGGEEILTEKFGLI
ncbi:hypothetical protein SDJN03_06747, partial [Cucurbita argyrosperma subsp. sororia]